MPDANKINEESGIIEIRMFLSGEDALIWLKV